LALPCDFSPMGEKKHRNGKRSRFTTHGPDSKRKYRKHKYGKQKNSLAEQSRGGALS